MDLEARKKAGVTERAENPGYGWCYRCKRPWSSCERHLTEEGDGRGCFPLCEECWSELSPEKRLQFYRAMWSIWVAEGHVDDTRWERIEKAVLAGK
jgi:hypothetical protein